MRSAGRRNGERSRAATGPVDLGAGAKLQIGGKADADLSQLSAGADRGHLIRHQSGIGLAEQRLDLLWRDALLRIRCLESVRHHDPIASGPYHREIGCLRKPRTGAVLAPHMPDQPHAGRQIHHRAPERVGNAVAQARRAIFRIALLELRPEAVNDKIMFFAIAALRAVLPLAALMQAIGWRPGQRQNLEVEAGTLRQVGGHR